MLKHHIDSFNGMVSWYLEKLKMSEKYLTEFKHYIEPFIWYLSMCIFLTPLNDYNHLWRFCLSWVLYRCFQSRLLHNYFMRERVIWHVITRETGDKVQRHCLIFSMTWLALRPCRDVWKIVYYLGLHVITQWRTRSNVDW